MNVVLIDGRSGSGKTSLAQRLAEVSGAQILALDDLYPGWNGLSEGSAAVATALGVGGYRRYDWASRNFAEWVHLDPNRSLIVEGCGAITQANLAAAKSWSKLPNEMKCIWLEVPVTLRRARALERDGDVFAPHWDEWAAQEEMHYSKHQPWLLAKSNVD